MLLMIVMVVVVMLMVVMVMVMVVVIVMVVVVVVVMVMVMVVVIVMMVLWTDEECQFVVDTSKAGSGALAVTVDGPSKVHLDCDHVLSGGYQFTYRPSAAGLYTLSVKYAGDQHIHGSPFLVNITPGQPPLCLSVSVCLSVSLSICLCLSLSLSLSLFGLTG